MPCFFLLCNSLSRKSFQPPLMYVFAVCFCSYWWSFCPKIKQKWSGEKIKKAKQKDNWGNLTINSNKKPFHLEQSYWKSPVKGQIPVKPHSKHQTKQQSKQYNFSHPKTKHALWEIYNFYKRIFIRMEVFFYKILHFSCTNFTYNK